MVMCVVGPDGMGNFSSERVPLSYSQDCDREKCICSNHDNYFEIAQERIENALTIEERREILEELFELEQGGSQDD